MRRPPSGGPYKLVAVDLDGTLLDSKGVPHAEDVRALRALAARGVAVTIVTGRLYAGTRIAAESLGLSCAVACADGSHIVEAGSHRTILHHSVRGPAAAELRGALASRTLSTFLFLENAIVHDEAGSPFLSYMRIWSDDIRATPLVTDHASWHAPEGVTAVVALGPEEEVKRAVEHAQSLDEHVQVAHFPLRRIEGMWGLIVRSRTATKGTALSWLAEQHGTDVSACVAVGDWLNDVPMLQIAGRSFAMGQAPAEVKAAATDLLEETHETGGGIAKAVELSFGRL